MRAVASAAGYAVCRPEVDEDSVDMTLSARGMAGTLRSPRLDLQLKCTARNLLREDGLRFPLKRKNYDELRGDGFLVPRILVVVTVPTQVPDWLLQSEEELALRHCGYWLSLREAPEKRTGTEICTQRLSRPSGN